MNGTAENGAVVGLSLDWILSYLIPDSEYNKLFHHAWVLPLTDSPVEAMKYSSQEFSVVFVANCQKIKPKNRST